MVRICSASHTIRDRLLTYSLPQSSIAESTKVGRTKTSDDWEEITGKVSDFAVAVADGDFTSPLDAYIAKGKDVCYAGLPLKATFKDGDKVVSLDATSGFTSKVYIGVKGDTNLDGICNAKDGTEILRFAAAFGTGRVDGTAYGAEDRFHLGGYTGVQEVFSFFLSDIDAEHTTFGLENANEEIINVEDVITKFMSEKIVNEDTSEPRKRTSFVNASDAVSTFRFAAKSGTNAPAGAEGHKSMPELWKDVFGTAALPKYSQEIDDYVTAHPETAEKQSTLDAKIKDDAAK